MIKTKNLEIGAVVLDGNREDRVIAVWPPDENGQIEITWKKGGWSADGMMRIMSAKFHPEHEFGTPCTHEWVWDQKLGRPNGSFVRTAIGSPSGDTQTKEVPVYNQAGTCASCGAGTSRTGTEAQLRS